MLQQNGFDIFEKNNYVVDFKFENYENNFYHVFDKFEFKNSDILNDCLYIDANDTKRISI